MGTRQLRFCFLASRDWRNPDSAGGDLYLSNLARELAKRGHDVTYLSTIFPGSSLQETIDNVKLVRLKPGYAYPLRQIRELLRVLRNVDLVVEEMFGGKKLPAMSLPLSGRRLVVAWYQRHDRIFSEQYPKTIAKLLSRFERLLTQVYRKTPVVTLSRKSMIELTEIGLNPSHLSIIPSAAVLERTPEKVPFNKREDQLVFIGKIRKYKRIDHALYCLRQIRQFTSGRNVKLIIAGNVAKNDRTYLSSLKDLSHELGIDGDVEFRIYPGLIPQNEKASLLRESKILLQPSPVEGFSMTTVEANMCGTPVVVSDGVPRDVVSHGDNGFVHAFGDIDSMASYSDKLLTDAGLWTQLSDNGLRTARKFTWENSATLLELLAGEIRSCEVRLERGTR